MKQFAVHSLGWGAGLIAVTQIHTTASSSLLAAVIPDRQENQISLDESMSETRWQNLSQASSPQLIAQSLGVRSLRIGDEGQDVRLLQRFLSDKGLYPYFADGFYGQNTADAVASYQDIRELTVTGNANESTLIDMGFDFLPETQPFTPAVGNNTSRRGGSLLSDNLSPGASGTDVISLQQRLNSFLPYRIFVDGIYGFETEQAVRSYQLARGLDATGIADSRTLESMGFSVSNYPYISAIIADESRLSEIQEFFPEAYVASNRRGRFIHIGDFATRFPAEAKVDAAIARGYSARVLYSRSGFLFGQ